MSKDIFNPKSKVYANIDRVLEHIKTGCTAPVLVEFDPSNACNHGCFFCLSGHIHLPESKGLPTFNRNMLTRDLMMRTCEELVAMDVRAVNWTGGGEPTANPALKECIEYLGKNNVKMGMFTNGTLIHTFDLFDTLLEHMTWVRFSIDAGSAETYDKIRRTIKGKNDWDIAFKNLGELLGRRDSMIRTPTTGSPPFGPDIGVGFVITPDTYKGIVEFAKIFCGGGHLFSKVDYVQFKPEITVIEKGGEQNRVSFWQDEIVPRLDEAKKILGDKFQLNEYKLDDLKDNPETFGRNYKKCLGSQISPCIGADGNVYVCTNHRGHSAYSYGSLHERNFTDIWSDIAKRQEVMHQIENVEKFSKCTALCKPHESNKAIWEIYEAYNKKNTDKNEYEKGLMTIMPALNKDLTHPEFI
jgi:radical SAM protein with 4Fe4S-binding SPASM domain